MTELQKPVTRLSDMCAAAKHSLTADHCAAARTVMCTATVTAAVTAAVIELQQCMTLHLNVRTSTAEGLPTLLVAAATGSQCMQQAVKLARSSTS